MRGVTCCRPHGAHHQQGVSEGIARGVDAMGVALQLQTSAGPRGHPQRRGQRAARPRLTTMLRTVVLLLVLANALFFAWTQGWLEA